MVLLDGSRRGDNVVWYNKGGWVFWMMLELLGRDAMLAGIHDFIARWKDGPDYPALQDFVEAMRQYNVASAR